MSKRVTTLFIEDTAIRYLVSKGKYAEKWASVPLEPGLVKHGHVEDRARLAEKLKETFRWAKAGNKVILGLSEPGSLYRIVTLPKLPEAILPEAIKREAERVIPLPQDEIYLAYQVISVHQEDMQIFLAAFSRNALDTMLSTLQSAGIKASSLDLVPLALCRAINQSTAIVVSLRAWNFEIAIMSDNIPQVIRSLSLPGEAESLVDKLPTIAEELERTVTFYNSSHPDKPLDSTVPVFVDGELVHVPESWPSLVGTLGNPVTPLPSIVQAEKEFDASQFTVNIGLALKANPQESTGSIINFNALPQAYLPEKPRASRIILPVGITLGAIILVFMGLQIAATKNEIKSVQSEITKAENGVAAATKEISNVNAKIQQAQAALQPLQTQIKTVESDMATVNDLTVSINTRRTQIDNYINHIVASEPESMIVLSVSLDENIAVSGTVPDYSLVYQFTDNLKATNMFSSINIDSLTFNGEDTFDFELSIKTK
jgi:type IV pilus assembly protein PilM